MATNNPFERVNRRRYLELVGGAGVTVTLAGCAGDEGEGEGEGEETTPEEEEETTPEEVSLRVGTSTGGTKDVGLAVERAVSQKSDILDYSTIESPGYIGTVYRLDQDQFDAGIVDTNTMNKAANDGGSFADEPVDMVPHQGFYAWPYSIYVMARAETDIETFDDLAGKNVYPAEPGFTTKATTLEVWNQPPTKDVYDQMNIMQMDVTDAPGAMEEGRIDASIAYGTPGAGNTGWVTEYDARVDVKYVEPTDALIESAEMFAGAGTSRASAESYQWQQDIGTDEIFSWDLVVTYVMHHDANPDAVYELCRVVDEHNETVREAEPRFFEYDSAEDMLSSLLEGVPIHPGAAQYYKDKDAWDDSYEVGE